MTARTRVPLAVLALAVCAAVVAAGLTKAVIAAREGLLEEMAGPESLEDPQFEGDLSRVSWRKVDDLIEKTTRPGADGDPR